MTLVEVLVAVAALTLIALGLSQVFAATGNTLRAGKRVSRQNEYAAMIERQLRRDFSQMTRDGFLVIRHRKAKNGQDIKLLDSNQIDGTERRVDEIVFFQHGDFASLRDPINPARQAVGAAARIYIGHGLRWDTDPQTAFETPRVDRPRRSDSITQATLNVPSFGEPGPNEFASDWILLRHVAVLAGPESVSKRQRLPGGNTDTFPDSNAQVGWQPAATSLFRFEAEFPPSVAETPTPAYIRTNAQQPLFASGLVDVASTDLSEIRSTILDAMPYRSPVGSEGTFNSARSADDGEDGASDVTRWVPGVGPGTLIAPNMNSPTRRMQAWMADAFPADSDFDVAPGNVPLVHERRMRCELTAPDYLGTLGSSGTMGVAFDSNESWRRTDQLMLSSSNFVPHCSEFIVEWSFGNVYPQDYTTVAKRGQLIWHGLLRRVGNNPTGDTLALPYDDTTQTTAERAAMQHRLLIQPRVLTNPVTPVGAWNIPGTLIHYLPPNANLDRNTTLYSCFGYLDPMYDRNSTSPYPETVEWAWPKMVRITMTLADPQSPGVEQTYEFVFDVPQK